MNKLKRESFTKKYIKLKVNFMSVFTYQLTMNKLKKQLFKKEPSTVFEHLKEFQMLSVDFLIF